MKKIFLFILLSLSFISCEENFEPFGDLKEKYALNCIIRGDTTFQIASLTKTYANENYNPYSNENDQSVSGALIRIWNGDSLATFRDTIMERKGSSQYKTPYHLYYTKKFKLVGDQLEIEAILPNNVRLSAKSSVPFPVKFISWDKVVPPKSKSYLEFSWEAGNADNAFLTQLSIYYYKADDPKKTTRIAYVPLSYVTENGRDFPIAPKPSNLNKLVVSVATLSKTMELISAGDPNKQNYVILSPIIEVASFGKSLSSYFNSINKANDAYTVNVNEIDYSNVDKGLGIFGVYMRNYKSFDFTHAYIKSFGYTPGLADVEPSL